MKNFKLLTLLAVLCTAAFVTSCEDEKNWQPTWAIPVVKETTLTVADFVDEDMTKDFNAQIKQLWDEYVQDQKDKLGIVGDENIPNIDSLAYSVITDPDLGYVEFTEDSIPYLTDSTKQELINNGVDQDLVADIDSFLNNFINGNIDYGDLLGGGGGLGKSIRVKAAPTPKASSGASVIDNLLDGITKNPVSIFPTVGTLMKMMPEKADSIDAQLDKVLQQADMNELIDLDLKQIAKDAEGVKRIEVFMEANNTLPFTITLGLEFVGVDTSTIYSLLPSNTTLGTAELTPLPIAPIDNVAKLKDIVNGTTAVRLKVDLTKSQPLTAEHLKVLADKGIAFNMRVKVKANMSKFIDL